MLKLRSTSPKHRRTLASAGVLSPQHRSASTVLSRGPAWVWVSLYLAVAILGSLLLFLVAVQTAWSLAMIVQPRELLGSESIVYDKAARLLRGESLYQPLDRLPYSVAAYTPLYYGLAGAGMAVLGPGFGPGRAISLIAGLASALLVGYLVARRTRDARFGMFAALLFLALGVPAIPAWSALYREHVLGVALSLGAITVLWGGTTTRRIMLAAVLAALAVLTKQTLLASVLAGCVYLWRRDRRCAGLLAGTCLCIVLTTCATLELSTGAFLANTLYANVNPFSFAALSSNLLIFMLFQGGATAIAGLYLLERWRMCRLKDDELLAWYWLASLLELTALAKVGAAMNYWIEFAAVSAVLATLGIHHRLAGRSASRAIVPILFLAATIVPYAPLTASTALPQLRQLSPDPDRVAELVSLTQRVRSEPGDVLADPPDVVVLAGRPLLFESYIFSILHREGRWDATPLIRRICDGGVGLVVMGQPLESDSESFHGYAFWATPVLSALRESMILETEAAGRFIYVPRAPRPSAACAEAA